MQDPYFIRIRVVYDLRKPVIKAIMLWRKSFTAGEMSLTLSDLEFRMTRASVINENKLEYQKAINAVKEKTKQYEQYGENKMSVWTKFTSWLNGWPEGGRDSQRVQQKEVQKNTTSKPKAKKAVGLKPKKKKKITKK